MRNVTKELPDTLYRIYDLDFERYWANDHGKSVWNNSGHAINSWNFWHGVKFSSQKHFVIREFQSKGWKLIE